MMEFHTEDTDDGLTSNFEDTRDLPQWLQSVLIIAASVLLGYFCLMTYLAASGYDWYTPWTLLNGGAR